MIHKWQTRRATARSAPHGSAGGGVRHAPDTDWAGWLGCIVDLSSAKADVGFATELLEMAKANAGRIVAGMWRARCAGERRRSATGSDVQPRNTAEHSSNGYRLKGYLPGITDDKVPMISNQLADVHPRHLPDG